MSNLRRSSEEEEEGLKAECIVPVGDELATTLLLLLHHLKQPNQAVSLHTRHSTRDWCNSAEARVIGCIQERPQEDQHRWRPASLCRE